MLMFGGVSEISYFCKYNPSKLMKKEDTKPKHRWGDFETKHSMQRRSPWHDYNKIGTYMLTLTVADRQPLLGTLVGTSPDDAHIELSPLGEAIRVHETAKISHYYPMVEVWRLCIMPDHLHMIVRVKADMPEGRHLGLVVAGFKGGCSKAAMNMGLTSASVSCTSVHAPTRCERNENGDKPPKPTPLFSPGYNDKILLHEGQLDNWKHYLDDNPRRLFLKRQNPQLFTILHNMDIANHKCQIVGNRFLLDIPDKVAVIVHRRYTDEENARLRNEWLACGERGGVLVSAAISPKEKEVLREAMNRHYRIILLRENGFPELYKPTGESFDACSAGLLLQISPREYHMERKTITRSQCLELNNMAEQIVGME